MRPDALEQLVNAELIFDGTPPDAEYTFKHALVQAQTSQAVQMQRVPDVFEIPEQMRGKPASLAHSGCHDGVIVVATLALVVANEVPSEPPQVTVGH